MDLALPGPVAKACTILAQNGRHAYLVGGAVRDRLLGLDPLDWDITTEATPQEVRALFERSVGVGERFGTVTVLLKGQAVEITTMRRDGPYSDSRHPDHVFFTDDLHSDLARRDFTINAIAYDPQQKRYIDPFSGIKHLRRRLLSAVGDPTQRFGEDPLRQLRLVRFQATLGFKIAKKTRLAVQARLINSISPERILAELNKMLLGKELRAALTTMYTNGLLGELIPELTAGRGISPGKSHPYDLLGHSIAAAHFAEPTLALRWAALLHDVGKTESLRRDHAQISAVLAEQILHRLRAANQLISEVTELIAWHMFTVNPHSRPGEIRKFLAQVGTENAFKLIKLRQADMAGMNLDPRRILAFGAALKSRLEQVLSADTALTASDLQIDGYVLMNAFGLGAGPIIGQIIDHLLEQVWEQPELNQTERLLELAGKYLESTPKNQV